MSCFCFGGICVPYTAVFTFLLIVLKWVADKTGLLGLLPESITKRLGLAGICNDDCCKVPSNIDMNKVGEVTDIKSEEEWATVKKDHKVIVAKFTASWCNPCKAIHPFYCALSGHYPEVYFCTLDVDELDAIAAECNVTMMPTFCIFKDGKKVNNFSGANETNLEKFVKDQCSTTQ